MVYHCLQTEGFPFMIGGVSGVIVDFILYLIYSQCYFWVHDPLNILPYSTVVIQQYVGVC